MKFPHTCYTLGDHPQSIQLIQTGVDRFKVIYGKQVESGLNYSDAAHELGACIMHRQACEGELDNRTEAEARADA
jgi:hypothetical protein